MMRSVLFVTAILSRGDAREFDGTDAIGDFRPGFVGLQ